MGLKVAKRQGKKERELPTFEVIDAAKWEELRDKMGNANAYGKSIVEFAARWAQMMEQEIAKGATIAACAQPTALALDEEMRTADNVYGYAVETLGRVWKHGAALKAHYGI